MVPDAARLKSLRGVISRFSINFYRFTTPGGASGDLFPVLICLTKTSSQNSRRCFDSWLDSGGFHMNRFATYEEENIHYWTHRAPGYSGVNQEELATDQKRVWGRTIQERIAARFPGRKPGSIRVLDVGTGPGFFAIILARMGYQVTAVDYTASMLEEARRNAGALADKIDFRQMNAEELMFADHSFDVLVTRNVTWNLHDPEKAYSHWTRVLAPGGLLLNFDANWYRYLWDEEAELGHKRDRENLAVSDVRDENAGTDVDAMEAIARKTPLSRQHRPQWDLRVLSRFGIQASADEAIWQRVWTKEERINNASTPMFLIEGRKAGLLES